MKSVKDYITVTISIAALLISAITFYLTRLHDPGISVEISPRLEWITDKHDRETFILPVTITNSGSKGHVVNQIVLQIRDGAGNVPQTFVADRYAVNRGSPFEFTPESLTPGTSVARSYLFDRFQAGKNTLRNVGKATIAPSDFALKNAGAYRGTLLLRQNGSHDLTVARRFTFDVDPEETRRIQEKPYDTQLILNLDTGN